MYVRSGQLRAQGSLLLRKGSGANAAVNNMAKLTNVKPNCASLTFSNIKLYYESQSEHRMDTVCGIGCRIATLQNGKLHFVEIHSWGGAALSGHVFVGDELITVDGIPVASSEDARRVILGKLGTELTLGIRFLRICAL